MEEIKGFDVVLKELSQVKKVENIILKWFQFIFLTFIKNVSYLLWSTFYSFTFISILLILIFSRIKALTKYEKRQK
jgi:hypothetical protein